MYNIAPIVLASIAFVQPNIALVKDSNSSVKSVTVSIVTPDSNGSGVIISRAGNKYTVLTAAHVVRDSQQTYSIGTSDNQKHQLSNVRVFPKSIDLAVVEFASSKAYPVAKIGNSDDAEEGSGALVSGYPRSGQQLPVYGLRKGRIVANSNQEFADGYGIVYSASTLPGMSGGGVFNDRGELIAIHGKGDITANLNTGSNGTARLKTGYDLGIPINTFAKLAKSVAGLSIAQSPATARNRPRAGEAFLNGLNQYRAKNYSQAIGFFDQAIKLDPKDATAYYYRGLCYKFDKNFQAAFSDFDQAIKLNPQDSFTYLFRATGYIDLKKFDQAEADLTRSIQIDPNNSYAYMIRGLVTGGSNSKKAFADMERAILIDPSSGTPYEFRSFLYLAQNNRPKFLADLKKASELYKASGDIENYTKTKNLLEVMQKYGNK